MSRISNTVCFSLLAAAVAVPALAQNAPVELDPSGQTAPPPEPPPKVVEEKQPIIINMGGENQQPQAPSEAESGYYYYSEDLDAGEKSPAGLGVRGPVPETHVVQSGDTLWDLCGFYFNDPWQWPRIWSYNPSITSPHWIYPGDLVRLYPASAQPHVVPVAPGEEGEEPAQPVATSVAQAPQRGFSLRHLAFLDAKELENPLIIDGAVEEKLMLTAGDQVYLRYSDQNRPKPGEQLSVYEEVQPVVSPKTGEKLGSFVRIRGDLDVRSVKDHKRARAAITRSNDVIERGFKVGPIKKIYGEIEPRPNQTSLEGLIVGKIDRSELIDARQVVIIDQGKDSGIQPGNHLYIIRRGDAYPERTDPTRQVGQNDEHYPARALGEVVIVDVKEHISLGLVTMVRRELGVGDMVVMSKNLE